LNDKQTESFI